MNEVEGHERKAEDDTYPFLTSFTWKRQKTKILFSRNSTNDFPHRTININTGGRAAAPRSASAFQSLILSSMCSNRNHSCSCRVLEIQRASCYLPIAALHLAVVGGHAAPSQRSLRSCRRRFLGARVLVLFSCFSPHSQMGGWPDGCALVSPPLFCSHVCSGSHHLLGQWGEGS